MPASSGLPSLISDPYGINLSGAPWTWLRFACTAFPRTFSLLLPSFVSALTTRVAIRTRVIDDAVRAAVAKGATQILILGAGLDARSVRLHSPSEETASAPRFFEVDHPATQAAKLEKMASVYPPAEREKAAKGVVYVAVDFTAKDAHTQMTHALTEAGFDTAQHSVVIMEGLIPYLTEDDGEFCEQALVCISER